MALGTYRVLRGCVVGPDRTVWPGDEVELEEEEGDRLCLPPGAVLVRLDGADPAQAEPAPAPEPDSKPPRKPRRHLPRAGD